MEQLDLKEDQLIELFSEKQIQDRIKELANEINQEFSPHENLIIIGILCGSAIFTSDLARYLKRPLHLEFVRFSSYGNNQCSSGKINVMDLNLPDLNNKNVLIVEDIIDTGLTIKYFIDYIKEKYQVKKVKVATLLNKTCSRAYCANVDFAGFEVGDHFVVGYGLDYKGFYRNLPYIGYFPKPES